ncbi:glucan phosphorylase [Paraburkholderia sp. WSM4177]|nr:glucan phosphorylase [Paraburkholderia sp. WSM4177]MBB5487658.1 glucan phosphorylase [Paraburkholderia sp. WSM4180]
MATSSDCRWTKFTACTWYSNPGAGKKTAAKAGDENFFLFGLTAEQIERVKHERYRPAVHVESNAELREALDLIAGGFFSRGDPQAFRPLVENLLQVDPFLVLADYADYVTCQDRVSAAWQDPGRWTRMSILNTAHSEKFSSDRAIDEYCERIWNSCPVRIVLDSPRHRTGPPA